MFPPQTMTPAAKLRPSPNVPGSMEAAVKMWLKVGNIQKLQQVRNTSLNFFDFSLKTLVKAVKGLM